MYEMLAGVEAASDSRFWLIWSIDFPCRAEYSNYTSATTPALVTAKTKLLFGYLTLTCRSVHNGLIVLYAVSRNIQYIYQLNERFIMKTYKIL
jgi:hypothetical protein